MAETMKKPKRETKVLSAGLPRTGSASMAAALTILGYKNVHHGLQWLVSVPDWGLLRRAGDASCPVLPTYTGETLSREDWDELFGSCEAVTDICGCFPVPMIKAYPEAKVILVIRDFDSWSKSYEYTVSLFVCFKANLAIMLGSEFAATWQDLMLGFSNSRSLREVHQKLRTHYDNHNRRVQELVPPERLLVCRLGDGWEPICRFLGKPVPDVPFPRVNDGAELTAAINEMWNRELLTAVKRLVPWVVVVAAVAAGAYWAMGDVYKG